MAGFLLSVPRPLSPCDVKSGANRTGTTAAAAAGERPDTALVIMAADLENQAKAQAGEEESSDTKVASPSKAATERQVF